VEKLRQLGAAAAGIHMQIRSGDAFVGQVERRPKQNWQLRTENFNNSTAQSGKSHSLNDADEILMKYRIMQKPHTLSDAGSHW